MRVVISTFGLALALWIAALGCGSRQEATKGQVFIGTKQDTIKGQIFIVTQSRENVKLGLVSVLAFPDSTILAHIASRQATADAQRKAMQQAMQPRVDAAQKALADARQRFEVEARRLRSTGWRPGQEEAHDDDALYYQLEHQWHSRAAELAAVQAHYKGSSDVTSEFYLAGLPRPLTEAKSDANGEFDIQVPSDQPVVLAAFAQRQVVDRTESYYWLVRVPVGAARGDKLLMSNDNLTTANSPLSLIHTAR